MNRRRPPHGLTLLELIVAMTITALVMLALYASLRVAFTARAAAEGALQDSRRAATIIDLLGRDLAAAARPNGVLAGAFLSEREADAAGMDIGLGAAGEPGGLRSGSLGSGGANSGGGGLNSGGGGLSSAAGAADWVQFVTHTALADLSYEGLEADTGATAVIDADRPVNAGLERVEYLLVNGAEGDGRLVRRSVRNLLAETETAAREMVVAQNVRSWGLRFFDGTSWLDRWDSAEQGDRLPPAVEMTLELGPAERPTTIVHVFGPLAAEPAPEAETVTPE